MAIRIICFFDFYQKFQMSIDLVLYHKLIENETQN